MPDDRKKPLWPWVVALLIGLTVLYVALFGPACWGHSRSASSIWEMTDSIYQPILWTWYRGPVPIKKAVGWYANLASAHEIGVAKTGGGRLIKFHPIRPDPSAFSHRRWGVKPTRVRFGIPESKW